MMAASASPLGLPLSTIEHRHQIDMHIARVGLNYRFGPVVARY